MNSKEEYKRLLEIVKNKRKEQSLPYRNEDIAKVLGYNRAYFSTLIGDNGVVKAEHIKQLKLHFPYLLENVTSDKNVTIGYTKEQMVKDILQNKAMIKTLLHLVAELKAKKEGRPVADILMEINESNIQNVIDLTRQ